MKRPVRIQRRRTPGWRMPPGAVYVGRPTKWGNPFRIKARAGIWDVYWVTAEGHQVVLVTRHTKLEAARSASNLYRAWLLNDGSKPGQNKDDGGSFVLQMAREELAGKDLACFCAPGMPCHADVLIDLVNGKEAESCA